MAIFRHAILSGHLANVCVRDLYGIVNRVYLYSGNDVDNFENSRI